MKSELLSFIVLLAESKAFFSNKMTRYSSLDVQRFVLDARKCKTIFVHADNQKHQPSICMIWVYVVLSTAIGK